MLLRECEFKGTSSFADARQLASSCKRADPHGHRAEFIRSIDAAASISLLRSTSR
jgi:hypothetical protein